MMSLSSRFCVLSLGAIFFLAGLASGKAASPNLLAPAEPSAGDSPDALWSPVRNKEFQGDLALDATGGRSGGPCLKIIAAQPDAASAHCYGEWRFKAQPAVEAGAEYRFRMWVKGLVNAPADAGVYVNIYGLGEQAQPKPLFIRFTPVSEGDWTELSGTFTAPNGVDRVRVGVGISQGVGWAAFDGLWLAPSSETPES